MKTSSGIEDDPQSVELPILTALEQELEESLERAVSLAKGTELRIVELEHQLESTVPDEAETETHEKSSRSAQLERIKAKRKAKNEAKSNKESAVEKHESDLLNRQLDETLERLSKSQTQLRAAEVRIVELEQLIEHASSKQTMEESRKGSSALDAVAA